ncbi:hypothetical protein Goarm_002102 [Gossypium armourianum]|uniref:F-box/kelch-repeat protein At3g27150-like n=1 Tax=Gossypium armourianum TaxID=34283 RepID=A0A7J9K710_9ROSI|nr:hypothetical protein [Gossypium armourianum]
MADESCSDPSDLRSQDVDYSYVPELSDELESLILARFPRSEHWKLYLLNKHFSDLLKSGELNKIRKEIGFKESSIFMSPSGQNCWWACDGLFKSCRKLPELPSLDICFINGDKESVCAGSHLIVSGRETFGSVVWRFELETGKWFKGPSMIDPRMHQKRKLCSGCFMDKKFYVIGGRDEHNNQLTCGEAYDKDNNTWEWIPDMLKDDSTDTQPAAAAAAMLLQSPPLVAVVNNELYCLETSCNEVRVYMKSSKTWKNLGKVPVRADLHEGWGVAFKSLGNELLVIGFSSSVSSGGNGSGMTIYTCSPRPESDDLKWRRVEGCEDRLNFFLLNCSVMVA